MQPRQRDCKKKKKIGNAEKPRKEEQRQPRENAKPRRKQTEKQQRQT